MLVAAAVSAAVYAQNHTVSPRAFASTAGNNGNTIPFWSATHHYMQLHGDLRGTPLVIRELSLRRWSRSANTTSIARTIDLEGHMGPCNALQPSTTFANNYTATPVNVYTRKLTSLPDWTANQGSPAPWSLIVPNDVPYMHGGNADLAWEWLIHSTTSTGSYFADLYSGETLGSINVVSGASCLATGRMVPMTIDNATTYNANTDTFHVSWSVFNAPANAMSAFLLGVSNPSVPVPGFCTSLYSSADVILGVIATATGFATTGVLAVPFSPGLVGAQVHAQGVCLDSGRTSGLPVSGSNAVQTTLPRPAIVRRIWVNDVNAMAGSLSETYPYGLIIRLTHQ